MTPHSKFLRVILIILIILEIGLSINWVLVQQTKTVLFYLFSFGSVILLIMISLKVKHYLLNKVLTIIFIYLIITETVLELLGWMGWLPGINFSYPIPYGRHYHTNEASANGVMNRYGWYYPEITSDDSNNIILIGDSYVEGGQIIKTNNIGKIVEQQMVTSNPGRHCQVISLGYGGSGPAQYLELTKYSIKHFHPKAIVIFLFMGNDFSNVLESRKKSAFEYITYLLDQDKKNIKIHPESKFAIESFNNQLEVRHKNILLHVPFSIVSNLMLPQVIRSISNGISSRNKKVSISNLSSRPESDFLNVGLEPFVFKTDSFSIREKSILITEQLLLKCYKIAFENNIEFMVVTIPWFPNSFYDQSSADWVTKYDGFDLLLPEEELITWAQQNKVHFLAMGHYMKDKRLTPNQVKKIYLGGTGHFSKFGHDYFGRVVAHELNLKQDSMKTANSPSPMY